MRKTKPSDCILGLVRFVQCWWSEKEKTRSVHCYRTLQMNLEIFGSFWKMACTSEDSMPLAHTLCMFVSISLWACVCVHVCVCLCVSVCVCVCVCMCGCLSQINEEEETFRLYPTTCQVCAVLVRWEGGNALCTLLSYITTSSTCMYDEQPHCVCVSISLSVYLCERVLFAGSECSNHSKWNEWVGE